MARQNKADAAFGRHLDPMRPGPPKYVSKVKAAVSRILGRDIWDDPVFKGVWARFSARFDEDEFLRPGSELDAGIVIGAYLVLKDLDRVVKRGEKS